MKAFNYPGYQSHKEEHNSFTNKIAYYAAEVIKGEYQIASELLEYVSTG